MMRNRLLRGAGMIVALAALGACSSLGDPAGKLTANAEPTAPQTPAGTETSAFSDYELGKHALNRGDVGKAIEHFLRAHRKNPESLEGINALAVAYEMVGRPDLANRYFDKALALAPTDPDILNNIGYAYLRRGDEQTAQRYLKEAKAIAAGNEVIMANIALLESRPEPVSDLPQEPAPPVAASAKEPEALQTAALPKPYVTRLSGKSQLIVTEPDSVAAEARPTIAPLPAPPLAAVPVPAVQQASLPAPSREKALPDSAAAEPEALLSGLTDAGMRLADQPAAPQVRPEDYLQAAALPPVKPDAVSRLLGEPLRDGLGQKPETPTEMQVRSAERTPAPEQASERLSAVPVSAVTLEPLRETRAERPSVASIASEAAGCDLTLAEAKITLVNGNGREGMARRTRGFLKLEGLITARLLNADHYSYRDSTIRYRASARCTAERLAATLDSLPKLVRDDDLGEDLRVLLGADLLSFDSRVAGLQSD